jgi:AraC-like DNA-binding protein
MSLTVVENSLYIFTGLIGLIVLIIMGFSFKSNKLVNLFLCGFIFIASCRFLVLGSYGLQLQKGMVDFPGSFRVVLLVNAPFLYLYFKAIAEDQTRFSWGFLRHMVLPFVFFLYISWYYYSSYYGTTEFRVLNFSFTAIFLSFYLIKSFQVLNKKVWKNAYSVHAEHFRLMRNWTIFLFSICTLLFFRSLTSVVTEMIYGNAISGTNFYILHAVIWLAIFAKILISPEILFGLPHLTKKIHSFTKNEVKIDDKNWIFDQSEITNQQDLKLKDKMDERITNLIEEIENLALNLRYFRNQKITIADVANELGVPVSHLVYLFKYHSKMTFTEFKTFNKIEDAKELIENGFLTINTLESLAAEVGFSSYNPFFTAFKKLTGLSPNEYAITKYQKEETTIVKRLNIVQ